MTVSEGSEDLATQIARRKVSAGHVIAWWLGGSGFVFKTPAGTQI